MNILTYADGVDDYGQRRRSTPSATAVDMVVKIYKQTPTNDMRFVDVDLIGITKYHGISDKNEASIDNVKYEIKYVIPSGRYYQILMKKI